ncbi:kinase-like domain-containing protein [Absidia repens]|uniref:non-specific serine/threonine protein kinase n=1 Tax=Absidia repens TaxID=90262 RepID=A0A1X2HYP1_9FUNG|nr:kinase-like domain-containing protein [Absidia repens]
MPSQRQSQNRSSSSTANVVGVHFKIGRKIGEGSFGVIYQGINLLNNQPVAVKFEPRKTDAPQLRDEYRAYKILAGSSGFPNAYFFGQEGLHNVLVIDLLGSSLEDLFDACSRQFSVKTVAMLAKEMVTRLQIVHEHNLVYRDIKPDNFLMGRAGKDDRVYMIDFGMAKHYRDPKTKQHIPYRERKSLSGTARYMSINTHLGREQSRRDDLESLGHVFMYFLRGSLPWQGLKAATNKQKYERIGERKQNTSIKELCDGYPHEFAIYLQYVRKLGFEENPDYDFCANYSTNDGLYDWMLLDQDKQEQSTTMQSYPGTRNNTTAYLHHASGTQLQSSTYANGDPTDSSQHLNRQSQQLIASGNGQQQQQQQQPQRENYYESMAVNSTLSHQQQISVQRKQSKWKRFWHKVGWLLTCGGCRGCHVKGWCCTCHCECD